MEPSRTATYRDDVDAYRAKQSRAWGIRPQRRDSPLRYLNISDGEIQEVQSAARGIVPHAIVNISGVVEGCPCEDGPGCTDQVWILATNADGTQGLLLSRIEGRWVVGPVQEWWLNYQKLQSSYDNPKTRKLSYEEYLQAERQLLGELSSCGVPPGKP